MANEDVPAEAAGGDAAKIVKEVQEAERGSTRSRSSLRVDVLCELRRGILWRDHGFPPWQRHHEHFAQLDCLWQSPVVPARVPALWASWLAAAKVEHLTLCPL